MPTGYTVEVQEGKVTEFKDFALRCARAFGACIMQRDEDANVLPKEQKPDPYYKEQYEKTIKNIEKLSNTTDEELLKEDKNNLIKETESVRNIMKEKFLYEDRYRKMLEKAKAWEPPTKDHKNLKKYMIEQLESSIDYDCNPDYYNEQLENILHRQENPRTAMEIRKEKLEHYERDLKYYSEGYDKEVRNVEKNNVWVRKLYQSLENGTRK